MKLSRFLLVLLIVPIAWAEGDAGYSLSNEAIRVAFEPVHGGLVSLDDLRDGRQLVRNDVAAECPLWRVELEGEPALSLVPDLARECVCESSDNALRWRWRGFGVDAAPELTVEATVSIAPGKAEARWRIAMSNLGKFAAKAVYFPCIGWMTRLPGETLAVPNWMGECTQSARAMLGDAEEDRQWDYPGPLSLQCVALYGESGRGMALFCEDPAAGRKSFALFGENTETLGLEVVHYPPAALERDTFAPAFDTVVALCDGGWFGAAERYREWGQEQSWARESRLRTGALPAWLTGTGLWIWNRGRSENVLVPAEFAQERAGVPVSVFWHWWHGCSYDTGFPEYLPPREGTEAFREAVAKAKEQGIHELVYMNQRLWGTQTKSWTEEGAERFAVKNTAGKIREEVYNTFTKAPCAPMCIGTPFWRNKYAGLAEQAVALGVDGIYMDQACLSLPCYDASHGHPLGGGAFWLEGFRDLTQDIRRRCDDKKPALAGEGCGEPWLPYLDAMLSLQVSMERYAAPGAWAPIPFFQAVYHDCALFYGNYSSLSMPPYDDLWPAEFAPKTPLATLDAKFARQFRLEQARAFVWGQQPTVANLLPRHFEERPEETAFALRLARLRIQALPFFLHGRMLAPPRLDVPSATLDMSRLSIYAGQRGALREYTQEHPLALGAAWQAPDGRVAVALVSISDEPLRFALEMSSPAYPLPATGRLTLLDEQGERDFETFRGAIALEVEMPPRDARVYVVF